MPSTPTAPPEPSRLSHHETPPLEAPVSICPTCEITDAVKHGSYTRNSHRRAPVRVQRYRCSICGRPFSPSLSSVEDGHQYPSEVNRLERVMYTFTDASLEVLQDICTVHFGLRPSDHQLSNWTPREERSRTCLRRRSSMISRLAKRDSAALTAPFGVAALACAEYCCSIGC
jgi:hypothetical protein